MHPIEQRLAAIRPNLIEDAHTIAVFEDVPLTMFATKFSTAGTPGSAITLADLREAWDVDAHYAQYVADCRLLKEQAEQQRGFHLIAVDLDPVANATDDDFWRLVIRCYGASEPPNVVYQTKRGAHLLWWLDPPLDNAEDFEARRSLLVQRLQPMLARTAYRADPACKDWTRLLRTPRCIRSDWLDDGTWTTTDLRDRPIWCLHTEGLDVREWELPLPPPRRIHMQRPKSINDEWAVRLASQWLDQQPGAVSGQGGHRQTFKVAIRLVGGFRLDEEAAYDLLAAWSEAKCDPPWSERELRHKISDAAKAVRREKDHE